MKQITHWILLIMMLLIVVGCGLLGGNITTGAEIDFEVGKQVYTLCGDVCLAKGQCGETTRNDAPTNVVLVNPSQPATEGHGAFIGDNTIVTVEEIRRVDVVFKQSGAAFPAYPFYKVRDETSTVVGWVDGACIGDKQR